MSRLWKAECSPGADPLSAVGKRVAEPLGRRRPSEKDIGFDSDHSFAPRVLFVSSSKANGGADRLAVDLAVGLRRAGRRSFSPVGGGRFTEGLCHEAGIPTDAFQLANSGDFAAALRLSRVIVAHDIEIVHAHARRDFVTVALAVALARRAMRQRPRLLLHVHLIRTLGEPEHLAGRFFCRYADGVVAVSDAVADF